MPKETQTTDKENTYSLKGRKDLNPLMGHMNITPPVLQFQKGSFRRKDLILLQ